MTSSKMIQSSDPLRRVMVNDGNVSTIMFEIGGELYPFTTVRGCYVCNAEPEVRYQVESGLRLSLSYAEIERRTGIGVISVANHNRKGHMPIEILSARAIVEADLKARGINPDEAEGFLVDQIAFARVGMQVAFERMVKGEIKPNMRDGIAFANFLARAEASALGAGNVDMDVMSDLFTVYYESVRQVVDDETMHVINREIEAHPLMLKLRMMSEARREAAQIESG